ncbi:hypothetical protein QBC39DRAFT_280810 [Podospora conica]|nr:hypothetical protein QBC39DRAFT_280810 [Schizothecium conicum]
MDHIPDAHEEAQALPEFSVTQPAMSKSIEMLAESLPAATQPIKIIPRVRKCSLVYFKNRFSAAEPQYAVDVLEADSPEIGPQIQDEVKARQNTSISRKRTKQEKVTAANDKAARDKAGVSSSMLAPELPKEHFHFRNSGKRAVLRIRIQSPALLRILSSILTFGEEQWTTKPRTFIRPFSALIYHHKAVLDRLTLLQERWGSQDNLDAGTPSSLAVSEHDGATISVDDCPAALQDLRAYVNFMNEEVLTFYTKFEGLHADDGKPEAKVRFSDLYYLFRPGELIFRPVGAGGDRDLHNASLGNRTWRCYGFRPPWAKYRISPTEHRSYRDDDDSERASFGLHCYYIDYTGEEFCVVTETFEIPPFKGERPVKSLKLFPYRFAANHQSLMEDSVKISQQFLKCTKLQHAAYQGWTITVTPTGTPGTDEKGNTLNRPEYIDSEVIVDFVEAFQTCPAWKPEPTVIKPVEPNPQHIDDDFSICWWSDVGRSKLLRETTEIIVLWSGIHALERNANLDPENEKADKFLVKVRENDRNGRPTTEDDLDDEDLPLLPSRIFAYVLRDRKFVQLVVQRLQPLQKSADAFAGLRINPAHKEIIQSLVDEHFRRKSGDRGGGVDFNSIDLIRGKGKGLFILLHGVPGVGKTATAEAAAAASGKPLFPITCGDLCRLTPAEVEPALLHIFRLADTWNCVLLLDEVDTFFSQRAKGDNTLAKNALISVFLRMLEYYDGLLFLTTNRPGALDEAFKSRIHLKLWYPHLTRRQSREIWGMNIDRLLKIEAERHLRDPEIKPLRIAKEKIRQFSERLFETLRMEKRALWSGRQIRNAFQVASALAHFDARRNRKDARLTVKHFRTIQVVTNDFDQFMHETIGKPDIEQSYERGERADHFVRKYKEDDSDGSDGRGRGGALSRRTSLERSYVTASTIPSSGGEYRSGFFDDQSRRSVSSNVAAQSAGTRGGRKGGGGGIFRSGGSQMAEQGLRLELRQNPKVAMATSDGNEGYLSPDLARAFGGLDWGMAGSVSGSRPGMKRARNRSKEDKRRAKRPRSNSNDDDDYDDDDNDDNDDDDDDNDDDGDDEDDDDNDNDGDGDDEDDED